MLQFNKHLLSVPSKLPWWKCASALSNSSSIKPKPSEANFNDRNNASENKKQTTSMSAKNENITESLASKITPDQSIDFLLNAARDPEVNVQLGTKILSIITNKINSGEAKVRDIFNDKRFSKLQEIILEHDGPKTKTVQKTPCVNSFKEHSVGSLVVTLKQLAIQRKRNIPILIALVSQIAEDDKKLTLRQCTDILYSMATLSFYNEIMLVKVIHTVLELLPSINETRTITSLLTSMGILRYRHQILLNALFDKAILFNPTLVAPITTALQTAATLDYKTDTVIYFAQNISRLYKKTDMPSFDAWVDYVWSLIILEVANTQHIASVLTEPLAKLRSLSISKKLKLLNINSAAMTCPNYRDRFLNEEEVASLDVTLLRTAEQQLRVQSLEHVLNSMMPSQEYFTTNINTNMGFYLDAECHYDAKGNPVELSIENVDNPDIKRIGIMLHSYNDYYIGSNRDLIGPVQLHKRLLINKKYVVVSIPYEEYSVDDSPKNQAKYLHKRIEAALAD